MGGRAVSGRVLITSRAFDHGTFSGPLLSSVFLERHLRYSIRRTRSVELMIKGKGSAKGGHFCFKTEEAESVSGRSENGGALTEVRTNVFYRIQTGATTNSVNEIRKAIVVNSLRGEEKKGGGWEEENEANLLAVVAHDYYLYNHEHWH